MKQAAIISIGTEIMRGKIDDTNSTFISRWLKDCGIKLKYRINVEDAIPDILKAIDYTKECDLFIFTGGLGPTDDDITRDALAKYLNKKLIFNDSSWHMIKEFFIKRDIPIAESNKRQAYLPEGGEHIPNENGTAPGVYYYDKKKAYFLIPGPPRENQPMLLNLVTPKLKQIDFIKGEIYTKIFRLYNVGESTIADLFVNFSDEIELGYYFTMGGWVEVHLSQYIENQSDIAKIEPFIKKAEEIFIKNDIFYTEDKNLSLLVLEKLQKSNLKIGFAESITGGSLAAEIVKNAGASNVFEGSIVSYSNKVKEEVLGVSKENLTKFGAVSEEVVKDMAFGLKKIIDADICISISGIAGPTGGSKNKPIGLVYIGFLIKDEFFAIKETFFGDRSRIITRCINYILVELLRRLK
ncbi:MAG: hypothetical protein A2086_03685 [Spirochaetes bacterium GWD1_27_9]|nr:MAG: hypothetical protein A2Z98_10060 [Spirochaetes bacterium GWB1_27_13]OHD40297.1 MAG: hypothetical protein A2086_03685 [Spirochaetes bacterium GWD1_27_9]